MVNAKQMLKIRKWFFKMGIGGLILTFLGILIVAIVPVVLITISGASSSDIMDTCPSNPLLFAQVCQGIITLIPVATMLILILAFAFLCILYPLGVLSTVAISRNDSNYKALWIIVVVFTFLLGGLGVIGAAIWELFGKKKLKL